MQGERHGGEFRLCQEAILKRNRVWTNSKRNKTIRQVCEYAEISKPFFRTQTSHLPINNVDIAA